VFKAKLRAAIIHGTITAFIGVLTGVAVFYIWYPGAFSEMSHGTELFLLVLLVEMFLGPVISLIIFNPGKLPSELIRDYCIVGLVQFAALFYGMYSVFISRPVYMVFVKDRIEVVSAVELSDSDLEVAAPKFKSLPKLGPRTICVEFPANAEEKSDLLLSSLNGRDIQLIPKYYRECFKGEIASNTYTREDFVSFETLGESFVPNAVRNDDFTWLPVVTRFGAWLVIFPGGDVSNHVYVNEDPFS